MPDILDVWHHRSDGYHKFTSPHVPGLYLVAEGRDLQEVYQEIPNVIAAIVKADFGHDVAVARENTCSLYHEVTDHMPGPTILHFSMTRSGP